MNRDDEDWDRLIAGLFDLDRLLEDPARKKFEEIDRPEGPGEIITEHPDGTVTVEKVRSH